MHAYCLNGRYLGNVQYAVAHPLLLVEVNLK